ncbi:hypothetical protein R3P38DRAFT_2746599 [Favolaschia claudopus]|uniref:EF-hand domain-containing protein n=1 Tax=Favolaschia claudopus TaxID=2862362 RepID=A0AAV9ZFI1_9AGAR
MCLESILRSASSPTTISYRVPSKSMESKIQRAEKALSEARALIKQAAEHSSDSKKARKQKFRKVLESLQQVMYVFGGFAEIDSTSITKTVVGVFSGVLQVEITNQDNDEEIVAVCYAMGSMIFVLRYLNQGALTEGDLIAELDTELSRMAKAMENFGAFAAVYHGKCKSWVVRFAHAADFKAKIKEFSEEFAEAEQRLKYLLIVRMAVGQGAIAQDVAEVKDSISTLIDRIGTPTSDNEKQAMALIQADEHILETLEGVKQLARTLNEAKLVSTIREALSVSVDELVERNSAVFDFKLRGATMVIGEAIDKSTNTILFKMDEGPHDLIEEADIKKLWKDSNWKFSVKCRIFADALYSHYADKFSKAQSEDAWTLKILSQVINYPSIGEAIDEDASGYISVYEIVRFLKKKTDVSTPVWFAFWAVGTQYLDYEYTNDTNSILRQLKKLAKKAQTAADENVKPWIEDYLEVLELIKCLTAWTQWDSEDSGLNELDEQTQAELEEVAHAMGEKNKALVEGNLKGLNYCIPDESSLPSITGQSAFRIEQSISVLLYVILAKHRDVIKDGMREMNSEQLALEWEKMWDTLDTLITEFHERFKTLRRNWRSQKMDIELQVECYAGGLFFNWYNEFNKDENIIAKYFEDDEEDSDEETDDSDAGDGEDGVDAEPSDKSDRPSVPAADSDAVDIKMISRRVEALDQRLDTVESLLRQILSMGLTQAPQKESSGPDPQSRGSNTAAYSGEAQSPQRTRDSDEGSQGNSESDGEMNPAADSGNDSGEENDESD